MKQTLKQFALTFARSKSGGRMVWFFLRYLPFLIPFKKLYLDDSLIVIHHPLPCYATHMLILPRIYLADFLSLDMQSEMGRKFVQSVFQAVEKLAPQFQSNELQMVINGGDFQDVRLLHMHLIENIIEFDPVEMIEGEYSDYGLLNLFLQAQEKILLGNYTAYRLKITLREKNKIQMELQQM